MNRIISSFAFVLLISGCASPAGRWGREARYAPALRGYVLTAESGSDDPTEGAPTMVLTDPLTGEKLQCQEQVARWIAPHQDHAEALVHDENVELATAIGFAPVLAAGIYLIVPGLGLMQAGMVTSDIASSDDPAAILAEGEDQVRRRRFDEGRISLERALVRDASLAQYTTLLLHLGVAYAELDRREEAVRALRAFIHRAAVRDVKAYRAAEGWLETLGSGVKVECRSRDPYPLRWSET